MEIANFLLSVVAIIIAGLSLWRGWSLQKRQDELTAMQMELAKAQLSSRNMADVVCQLAEGGRTERIVVANVGQAVARDVTFVLDVPEGRSSPLLDDYHEVFPVRSLPPGQSVSVLAALSHDTGTSFGCKCSWTNEDGTVSEKLMTLTL